MHHNERTTKQIKRAQEHERRLRERTSLEEVRRARSRKEASAAYLCAGGEWNPGPTSKKSRLGEGRVITVASYVSDGAAPCVYDGKLVQSSRQGKTFSCSACGVQLGGPGMQDHPVKLV